ncbi:hypothetical protein ACVIGA_001288 [Bradyrhizobium sp. USDA 3240]
MGTRPSTVMKLVAHASCGAVGAFVFGLCLAAAIRRFDGLYLAVTVLFAIPVVSDWFWTRREVRQLAAGDAANQQATQFLWSYLFITMLSSGFGIAVMAVVLQSADFTRTFGAIVFGVLTCIGIYPLVRDAKRLADTVEPRTIP